MTRILVVLMASSCLSCSRQVTTSKAAGATSNEKVILIENSEVRKRLKGQATLIAEAVVAADFEKVADMTHSTALQMTGGRAVTVAYQKKARQKTIESGGKIEIEKIDEPGGIVESRSIYYSYVPVTARIHQTAPRQVLLMKSIFIAISQDGGQNWKFVDDSGIPFREMIEKIFPDWPPNLKLPPQENPVVVDGKS